MIGAHATRALARHWVGRTAFHRARRRPLVSDLEVTSSVAFVVLAKQSRRLIHVKPRLDPNCDALINKTIQRIQSVQSSNANELATSSITDAERIYPTSRDLNLNEVDAYGFDYDYTIASYNDELHPLIYNLSLQHMVESLNYPKELVQHCIYDPKFAIRGLYYDHLHGNLLKLDYLYNVTPGYVYFGRKPLTQTQIMEQYGGFHVSPTFQASLRPLIDRFCLPEACLIADTIEYCKEKGFSFDPSYVYSDVHRAVKFVHASGLLHHEILHNIPKYLEKSTFLESFFRRIRQAGKKAFLLTNSPWNFVNAGMKYLMNDNWRDLFDIIIVGADKPNWFVSQRRPFRLLDLDSNRVHWEVVPSFVPGQVYVEGSLVEFHRMTQLAGSRVAYFGDHLFSDVREPSRISGWRTGVIIEELEHEVRTQNTETYRGALQQLLLMEDLYRRLELVSAGQKRHDDCEILLNMLNIEIPKKRATTKQIFNQYFGSVFRTHTNPTLFAYLLQRYADIYTSKLENLQFYPLDFVHHAEREFMPHERSVRRQIMTAFEDRKLNNNAVTVDEETKP